MIKAGVIGLGRRGFWIANMVKNHGGYEITAVADYFEERAKEKGRQLGVPEGYCYSGLDGYRKLIASGVDAVFLETPPCFFPEHAKAAVDVEGLYGNGATRNIATFHESITSGFYDNPTVAPRVNSTLATILGREAGRRKTQLTLKELIQENRALEVDTSGLKV